MRLAVPRAPTSACPHRPWWPRRTSSDPQVLGRPLQRPQRYSTQRSPPAIPGIGLASSAPVQAAGITTVLAAANAAPGATATVGIADTVAPTDLSGVAEAFPPPLPGPVQPATVPPTGIAIVASSIAEAAAGAVTDDSLVQTRIPQIVQAEAAASSPSVPQTGPSLPLAKAIWRDADHARGCHKAHGRFPRAAPGGSYRRNSRRTVTGGSPHLQSTGQPRAAEHYRANWITADRLRKPDDCDTVRSRHRRWPAERDVGTTFPADCNRRRGDRDAVQRAIAGCRRGAGGHIARVETGFAGGADGARPGVAGP